MIRRFTVLVLFALGGLAAVVVRTTTLPNGWRLSPSAGALAMTGTFPQGLALSPNGTLLAVVESGFNPPVLRLLRADNLMRVGVVKLPNAFGKPVWESAHRVLVAGGASDTIFVIDTRTASVVGHFPTGRGTWPANIALSPDGTVMASANDASGDVSLVHAGALRRIALGAHPADLVFSPSGGSLYVALRGADALVRIDLSTFAQTRVPVAGHPCALAVDQTHARIEVAACDADRVDTFALPTLAPLAQISVAIAPRNVTSAGDSPNALAVDARGDTYVSLAARNAVAVIHDDRMIGAYPVGWYPTGVALGNGRLYSTDGNGEGTAPNPEFQPFLGHYVGYTAASLRGSVREARLADIRAHLPHSTRLVRENMQPRIPADPHAVDIVRAHGPIAHVIYIIKENRTYDQVLGDIPGADGDPHLVWFGQPITPNQHALAQRFGVFDRFFVDARVSADGHNWSDAAFANDYVERFWPANYAGRRSTYDFQSGAAPDVPGTGYLWDAARRAHVSYRDYGEDVRPFMHPPQLATTDFADLPAHIDPRYVGWNLNYSDLDREREWQRQFAAFVKNGHLPQLEIVYLPDDHTAASDPGKRTPDAFVAANDLAIGRLVDAVSHSPYWGSTAIFALEDDAQNGPDHVSDQRSTFYLASPYARGGVIHGHYDTAAVLHTIEILLGIPPMNAFDALAPPLDAAFTARPHLQPFSAVRPQVHFNARNPKHGYGAAASARMNWQQPDAASSVAVNGILAHLVAHPAGAAPQKR